MQPGATISLHMSNVETIPGRTITASLGLVTGSTVRAKHIGKDIFAGLKNIVGGELKAYTELLNESRNEAIQRMMMQAHAMGANGVVNVRFATSNVETIPGKTITASLGLVTGSTVRAKHIGKDIFAGLKNIVGGELKAYTELLNESRNEAIQRMMMQAHSMGANGVVNVRFATSNVAAGASELFCYGTAVVVE